MVSRELRVFGEAGIPVEEMRLGIVRSQGKLSDAYPLYALEPAIGREH
jgi:hypothetical protein